MLPPNENARTWGMLCHLLALAQIPLGLYRMPFGGLLGPLIVWLVMRQSDPFIDEQGKESVNFQLTVLILAIPIVLALLVFGFATCCIGFALMRPILGVLWLAEVITVIIGGINAYQGRHFRYPINFRFIR